MPHYAAAVTLSWGLDDASEASFLLTMAPLLKLAFFGLLRPGEALNLRARDVRVPRGPWDRMVAVLAIRSPKTRRFMGRAQYSVIYDVSTVRWLSWLRSGMHAQRTAFAWRS